MGQKSSLAHLAIQTDNINNTIADLKSQWDAVGIDTFTVIHYNTKNTDAYISGEGCDIYSGLTMLSESIDMDIIEQVDWSVAPFFNRSYQQRRGNSIEHIAWAVQDYDEKIRKFEKLGFCNLAAAADGEKRWVQLRSIWMPGGFGIELLEEGMHDHIVDQLDTEAAKKGPDPELYRFAEIGVLVNHLQSTLQGLRPAFELLEIGDFNCFTLKLAQEEMICGREFVHDMAQVFLGPGIELLIHQPVEGENYLTDYLKNKGEGIAYIGFRVKNYDQAVEKTQGHGYKMVLSSRCQATGVRYAWFDTGYSHSGTILKLIEMENSKK